MPDHRGSCVNSTAQDQSKVLLESGLEELGLTCSSAQQDQLLAYLDLLKRWNKTYNLTSIRDSRSMLTRHLLDSLAIASYLDGSRFIDVGAGAGLPGVPLAITCPERTFDLLDSNGKKTRFLFQVRIELGLSNILELNKRVENYHPVDAYDGILSRGFAGLSAMIHQTRHALRDGGRFYAMKGKLSSREISALPEGFELEAVEKLVIPGLDEDRHLIIIQRK